MLGYSSMSWYSYSSVEGTPLICCVFNLECIVGAALSTFIVSNATIVCHAVVPLRIQYDFMCLHSVISSKLRDLIAQQCFVNAGLDWSHTKLTNVGDQCLKYTNNTPTDIYHSCHLNQCDLYTGLRWTENDTDCSVVLTGTVVDMYHCKSTCIIRAPFAMKCNNKKAISYKSYYVIAKRKYCWNREYRCNIYIYVGFTVISINCNIILVWLLKWQRTSAHTPLVLRVTLVQ